MPHYRCVFFDLDHTLWDYETNSAEALQELYDRYGLKNRGALPFPEFLKTFIAINNEMWDLYDLGKINRDALRFDRFHRVLRQAGVDDYEMSLQFSADYLAESPKKKNLISQAVETLDYLSARYPLFVITNGFDEIQSTKLNSSGIHHYFKKVITSEKAGHKKPARGIFDYALSENGYRASETIMIGDNLITDMGGARNAEIDHVFFNPACQMHQESVTYEIHSLIELKSIL